MTAFLILFSAALLLTSAIWFSFICLSKGDRWIYYVAVGLKIIVGWGVALLYERYYQLPSADTFRLHHAVVDFTRVIFLYPKEILLIFWDTPSYEPVIRMVELVQSPRVCFFTKILFFFNLISFDNYWMLSAWLSFFSVIGSVLLVKKLLRIFPEEGLSLWVSFLFIPSCFFWTSGVLKETVLWALICGSIVIFLTMKYEGRRNSITHWGIFLLLMWLIWGIKFYFFAALSLAFILSAMVPEIPTRIDLQWVRRWFWGMVVIVGTVVFINLTIPQLALGNFLQSLVDNHDLTVKSSLDSKFDGGYIHFDHLEPKWYSVLSQVPLALFSGLFRPLVWEVHGILAVLVSIQGIIVGVFFVGKCYSVIRTPQKIERMDLFVGIVFYIVITATLLAIASPNFGALERYKTGFYPFFVFSLLFRNPWVQNLAH
ncbi:MAG: hypothetical protein K2Q22_00465, partial [Cytophagales bacterium]|nr:hypothetical protein [Cytophagales bacterium]